MKSALIGHSGFVGETLQRQTSFTDIFRSTDIANVRGRHYDLVVCAAAPAQKWLANKDPKADLDSISRLIAELSTITCDSFVLISTVDVFSNPIDVYEDTPINEEDLQPYGKHRRALETFVQRHFSNHLIVRLPGLVGPGLRKNIIFDLLNDNNIGAIDSRSKFQFYPMVSLWQDIVKTLETGINLVHFTSEPVSVSEVASDGFGIAFTNEINSPQPACYDFRSKHAMSSARRQNYQYDKAATMVAIRAYAQTEPRRTADTKTT